MNYTKDELKDKITNILKNNEELVKDLSIFSKNSKSTDDTLVIELSYRDLDLLLDDIELLNYIISNSREWIRSFKEVIREGPYTDFPEYSEEDKIRVAITELPDNKIKTPRTLNKSKDIGNYIGLKGVARKVAPIDIEPKIIEFECEDCKATFRKTQSSKYIEKPLECEGCGKSSNKTNFKPNLEKSEYEDFQVVYIEEVDRSGRAGERPREEKAILWGDLVDKITSGDEVILYGIYSVKESSKGRGKIKPQTFFEVKEVEIENKEFDDQDLTEEERERVKRLAEDPEIFDKIARSIAPSIRGCEDIKKSIALQFFKGVEKDIAGNHHREDIHILLAGDPETGKSQLLDYASKISPRAMKGSGRSTTGAGLIAGAVQEEGEWYLEAGVLPLADRGIASIDELDKMREEDRNSIHRAMEQQEVTVNKADLRQTLVTRTSLLGACNPKEGRFTDRQKVDKDYMEEIRGVLDGALISRFDSIWIMTSDISEEEREKRTRHISELQREYGRKKKDSNYKVGEDHKPAIEIEDLKNYIKLGRSKTPEFTDRAIEVINDFTDDLSKELDRGFTPRQQLALIRYAEASAKAHLREEVLPEDSKRAIELKKAELERWKETGLDPEDYIEKKETGRTQRERTLLEEIRDIIEILEDQDKDPSKDKIIEYAERDNHNPEEVKKELERMRTNGEIYEPKEGVIKLA